MSEKPGGIYEAISAIMKQIGPMANDSRNEQQKFDYRSAKAMYNRTQPLFVRHGIFSVPKVLKHERIEGKTKSGSPQFWSVMEVEYTFYHEDGSHVIATVVGEGMDMGDKAASKAMTAAHKKAVFQILHIPYEADDPDAHTPEWVAKENGKITLKNLDELKKLWWAANKDHLDKTDEDAVQTAFRDWVSKHVQQEFEPLEWRQWTREAYDACLVALREREASNV